MTSQLPVDTRATSSEESRWRDARRSPAERAEALIPLMTLEEKTAQLVGLWVGADASGGGVAPHQAGDVELRVGRPSGEVAAAVPLRLVGAEREVGYERRRQSLVRVDRRWAGEVAG